MIEPMNFITPVAHRADLFYLLEITLYERPVEDNFFLFLEAANLFCPVDHDP